MTVDELPAKLRDRIEVVDRHWLWTGACNDKGYPQVRIDGRAWYVHRLVYALLVEDPAERQLHHDEACPKHCANPAHLEPLTHVEHKAVHRRSHCHAGHPMEGANVYVRRDNSARQCRACQRRRARAKGPTGRRAWHDGGCVICGGSLEHKRRDAKCCSPACKRAWDELQAR